MPTQLNVNQSKQNLSPPKRYAVFLLNDHYTPMDFVVEILMDIFHMPHDKAEKTMLQIHHEGKGLCGVYTRDIAETKQQQVLWLADDAGHPLMCSIQETSV